MAHAVPTLIGHRKDGRPIYLAQGAEDNPPPLPNPTDPPQPPADPPADKGYPDGTPVAEMNSEQQAAYWKAQARRHEDRVKALGVTPEQLADLRTKAQRAEQLDYELSSDKEKAVADARAAALAEAASLYRPQLVAARLEAAAAGRIEADKLATLLGPLDKTYFLTADGGVDADKVTAYIDSIAPAKGTETPPRKGPAATAHGTGGGGSVTALNGSELYDRMHPKKTA